jgi:hypothetical protein
MEMGAIDGLTIQRTGGTIRDARAVMENHLWLRRRGRLEQDLEENYHPQVVVLSPRAVYRGHQGIRESAHLLWAAVADAGAYIYDRVLVADGFAMLEWRARTDEFYVADGVDSYVIEDGLLVGQTIHYRVQDLKLSVTADALAASRWPGQVALPDAAECPTCL